MYDDSKVNYNTTKSGINYTTSTFYTTLWKCINCGNCVEDRCGECGHKKFTCTKLNILVEEDFYCKYYFAKITYQPNYNPPNEPTVWCTNTNNDCKTEVRYTNANAD